jgi:hypothetical protein
MRADKDFFQSNSRVGLAEMSRLKAWTYHEGDRRYESRNDSRYEGKDEDRYEGKTTANTVVSDSSDTT